MPAWDWAELKCLLRLCPIAVASLTGTVWKKKDAELDATQEPLAARAACWLAICSIIFFCISLGVGCAMWVATIQVYPSGSTMVPQRSPQNISITGPLDAAPSFTALATVLSAFSVSRYKLVGEAPIVFELRELRHFRPQH